MSAPHVSDTPLTPPGGVPARTDGDSQERPDWGVVEAVARLPILPLVTLVHRCARRVLPLCVASYAPQLGFIRAVAAGRLREQMFDAEHATYAACAAVQSAYDAARRAATGPTEPNAAAEVRRFALATVRQAAAAMTAAGYGPDARDAADRVLQRDLDRLTQLDTNTGLPLGPPVDPSENGPLGPLWPDAPPTWFRHLIVDERILPVPLAEMTTPPDPTTEPTWEEEHAAWMQYFAADKAGQIDPNNEHLNEWVAFYDGRVVGYGTDGMIEVQNRAAAELGVHWARVVVDYRGWIG